MTVNPSLAVSTDPVAVAVHSIRLVAAGNRVDFEAIFSKDYVDRENAIQPPASRVPGPDGAYATALWLRTAFADLRYDIHHAIGDGDLVAVNSTMRGRHVAPWVVYTEDGSIDTAFPPTNKTFATTQSHWFRVGHGQIVEHWANRDDLGTGKQLGWIPPTPLYIVKMLQAKRRASRA